MLVWGINDDVHDDWPANENIQKAKYAKKSANTQIQKRPVPTDSQIPSYLDHFPDDTSTRPFVHFAQLHKSGKIFLVNDNNSDNKTITMMKDNDVHDLCLLRSAPQKW